MKAMTVPAQVLKKKKVILSVETAWLSDGTCEVVLALDLMILKVFYSLNGSVFLGTVVQGVESVTR